MVKTRKVSILAFLLLLLFFSAVSYAASGPLNDWEKGVFLDIVEKWHDMLYEKPDNWYPSDQETHSIFSQVANKYNISVDEVEKIDDKGFWAEDLGEKEFNIYDELTKRLNAMPGGGSAAEAQEIHNQVANEYGISLRRLYEIEYKMTLF